MLTRTEAADPAVEELKRRARRRLVGAVVLALAAALVLPLLLESEPKPLGDDVSIRVAPSGSGIVGTPLSPAKGAGAKAQDRALLPAWPPSKPPAADAPIDTQAGRAATSSVKLESVKADSDNAERAERTESVKTERAESAESAESAKAGERAQAAATHTEALRAPASATPGVPPNSEPQKSVAVAPKAASGETRSPDQAAPAGGFVVQLAALADAKAAGALASKLRSAGFPAYTETLKTPQGAMRRVRVGPYATREAADAQLTKVSAAGFRGVVAAK